MGSKNHEVVPSTLVAQISGLRNGGVNKILGQLARRNLIARVQNTKCECALCCRCGAPAKTQVQMMGTDLLMVATITLLSEPFPKEIRYTLLEIRLE